MRSPSPKTSIIILMLSALVTPGCSAADAEYRSDEHAFRVVTVTRGLDHPWGMDFLPDGSMLITEKGGALRYVAANGDLAEDPITGVPPVAARGQGGLLDVLVDPDFANNGYIYLSFAETGHGDTNTAVVRARLNEDSLTDIKVIFRARPKASGSRHFGSRLLFAPDGKLLVTLGDRGDRPQAQDTRNHLGTVVRINPDGSVPQDNPLRDRANARPEIYSFGHRNVQGIALDRATGRIFTEEHGPQGGDEINLLVGGTNYGWPVITYGANYGSGTSIGEGVAKSGMAQPLHQWTPSIAPSGLAFYDGDKFPRWRGNLFAGSLKFQLLSRLELDGERVVREEQLLEGKLGRIRDVNVGPDGFIYLLSDERGAALVRLEPAD